MKSVLFSILFLMICSICSAHDLNWRDPVPPGMVSTENRGVYTFYKENEDTFLTFCKGKLCEISGRVYGRDALDKMLDNCIKAYGRPNYFKNGLWIWRDQTDTDFLIFYDDLTEISYYLYHYNPLYMEIIEERIQERKEKEHVQKDIKKARGGKVGTRKMARH